MASQILGWTCLGLFAFVWLVNGAYMLISPRTWLQLPEWFAPKGAFGAKHYSTSLGLIEVRAFGAVMLGVMGWVTYQIVSR